MIDTRNAPLSKLIELFPVIIEKKISAQTAFAGTLNIAEVVKVSRRELLHSAIIANLLEGKGRHRHPEYCLLFLKMVNGYLTEKPLALEQFTVKTEKTIDSGRRIDIFLEASSFVIVLENKVDAEDGEEQLNDYYKWAKSTFPSKRTVLCYLTLDGSDPSENSIDKKSLEAIKNKNDFLNLSYEIDILNWIRMLPVKETELVLKAALVQYTDLLEGMVRRRGEDEVELKEVVQGMESLYEKGDPEEIFLTSRLVERGSKFYLFVNFLEELARYLERKGKQKGVFLPLYFTHHQRRYKPSKIGKWREDIKEDFEEIGIELGLEDTVGIGLHLIAVPAGDIKPVVLFGIMMHGTNKETLYRLSDDWPKKDNHQIFEENSKDWGMYVHVSWIAYSLYKIGDNSHDYDNISGWFFKEWDTNSNLINISDKNMEPKGGFRNE